MAILSDKEAEEFGINEGLGAFIGKLRGDYTAVADEAKRKEEKEKAKAAKAEEKAKKQQELINRGKAQQETRNNWLDTGRWETKEGYLERFKRIEKELVKCLLNGNESEGVGKFNELKKTASAYIKAPSYKDARRDYENKFKNIGKGQQVTNEEIEFNMFDY